MILGWSLKFVEELGVHEELVLYRLTCKITVSGWPEEHEDSTDLPGTARCCRSSNASQDTIHHRIHHPAQPTPPDLPLIDSIRLSSSLESRLEE